uniref:Uncharacterized protein n=1 Tax=Timema genevievae TaxID=629358 RepID=A0A7R9PGB7_TIMGE|nr:unnamed protein product [Timema genevievae]
MNSANSIENFLGQHPHIVKVRSMASMHNEPCTYPKVDTHDSQDYKMKWLSRSDRLMALLTLEDTVDQIGSRPYLDDVVTIPGSANSRRRCSRCHCEESLNCVPTRFNFSGWMTAQAMSNVATVLHPDVPRKIHGRERCSFLVGASNIMASPTCFKLTKVIICYNGGVAKIRFTWVQTYACVGPEDAPSVAVANIRYG